MCDKTKTKTNEKHWTIQCPNPKCLCDDLDNINWVEDYPMYSKLYKEEDGSVTINTADGEIFWEGGGAGNAKFMCVKCGTDWEMAKNVDSHINWD